MTSSDLPEVSPAVPIPSGAGGSVASKILHNTVLLTASSLIVRALGLGMVMVLARYLKAEGYGIYQRAEAFVFLFSIVANLGLDFILTREVARNSPRVSEYLSGVIVLKLLLAPVCLALILGTAQVLGYHDELLLWGIGCYAAVLLLTAIGQAYDGVFQGLDSMSYTAIANLVNQAVFVALGGAFVLFGKDLHWILSGMVVAAVVRLVVSMGLLGRLHIGWTRPSGATLWYLLRQSIPLAFAASFVVVYAQLDAVMLGDLVKKNANAQVGFYRAAGKFLLFFTVLRDSFLVAVFPVLAAVPRGDRKRMGNLVTQSVRYQLIAAFYFIVCFIFLPRIAPKLLGEDFQETARVLPIMAAVLVPSTISITMGRVLVATGNQKRVMIATGITLLVNIGLNVLLIPRYASIGAAWAKVAGEVVVALVNVYYVQRYVAPTHMIRSTLRPALAAALVGFVLFKLPGLRLHEALPLAGVLYVAGLFALRTFSAEELRRWRAALLEGRARWSGRRGTVA
jgi:O-antigen/teichoic acid export membrane protein